MKANAGEQLLLIFIKGENKKGLAENFNCKNFDFENLNFENLNFNHEFDNIDNRFRDIIYLEINLRYRNLIVFSCRLKVID